MIVQNPVNRIFVSMQLKIKTFGIASDILGGKQVGLQLEGRTVLDLRKELEVKYPKLADLRSIFIAVNQKYAQDDVVLLESDEIALIPPVSGG